MADPLHCDWSGANQQFYSGTHTIMEIVPGAAGVGCVKSKLAVTAKTTSYTVLTSDFGSVFTTRGALAAVTFTLPAASGNSGAWVEFYNVADQDMIITGTDEELVVFNDATADAIQFSTASEQIGGAFRAICDSTSWIVVPMATETQTVTITSA